MCQLLFRKIRPSIKIILKNPDTILMENNFPPLPNNASTSISIPSIPNEALTLENKTSSKVLNKLSNYKFPNAIASSRRVQMKLKKLILWHPESMILSQDPLERGIINALNQNAIGAVFLKQLPLSDFTHNFSTSNPQFQSYAIIMAPKKYTIWAGLKWDFKDTPSLWSVFLEKGSFEISPPKLFLPLSLEQNSVRSTFGIHQTEWLTLVRTGSLEQSQGLVAMVHTQSMYQEIKDAIALIQFQKNESAPKQ